MKTRLLGLISFLLVFTSAAIVQNGGTSPAPTGNATFTTNLQGLNESSYSQLPYHPRFVTASDIKGESSSRKHSTDVAEPALTGSEPSSTAQAPCEKPAKLFSAREYHGPMERFTAWFTRKPEMTTFPTQRKDGREICALDVGQKFHLFYKTTVDPVTFVGAAASAGFSQWANDDREWGQGAEGYGKRYGAAFTDRATHNFFGKFFYPAVFQQDPRYFRQGRGSAKGRIGHALAHTFVARGDDGGNMANFSLWAATVSTKSLENLYHPGNDRGFGPTGQRIGISLGANMGWDVAKEFWPEIVRTLHLPFKERKAVPAASAGTP